MTDSLHSRITTQLIDYTERWQLTIFKKICLGKTVCCSPKYEVSNKTVDPSLEIQQCLVDCCGPSCNACFKDFAAYETRTWANAQRDGHPAKYRWRPVFNVTKFGWHPLLECHAVTLPRCETRWNLQGWPKLANRSQPLVGWSSPYYEDMWRRHCCLKSFFPIVNTCLTCRDTAWQSCAMVLKWRFFASCIFSEPRVAHFRHAF